MLADLLPMMTDTVRQLHAGKRDMFGKSQDRDATEHRARVTYSPAKLLGQASREAMPDATAIVWLINHPHPIIIGETFELPGGDQIKVARFELRTLPGGILHKVYLT